MRVQNLARTLQISHLNVLLFSVIGLASSKESKCKTQCQAKKLAVVCSSLRLLRFGLNRVEHVPARVEKPKLKLVDVLHALNSAINLLDDYVVIPSAIGSLLTVRVLVNGLGFSSSIG